MEAGSGLEGVGAAVLSDMFAVFCRVGGVSMEVLRLLGYDSVFQVVYRVKERDRRLQMAGSGVVG